MVLAKGIPKTLVKGVNTAELTKTIAKTNNAPVIRYHLKIPYDEGVTKTSLLLEVGNVRAVRDFYD